MKFLIVLKTLFALGTLALLPSAFTSCGNTMYGMGLDMEETGRRLQQNHNPYGSTDGYQQPTYNPDPYGGAY